jgi:hypothetical protein
MSDLGFQLIGLCLLLGALGGGFGLLRRRYATRLAVQQQAILLLTLLTLAGGFIGAIPWWLDVSVSFAWDLPPLASRLLAAAGWAFALACGLALRHPTQRHLWLIMMMLVVYLAPLALAILLFHLDRFDPAAPITYAFFAIVTTLLLPTLWFCWRPVGVVAETPADQRRPKAVVQGWLGLVALLTGLWGMALFVTQQGPSPLLWLWPQDLLASRLIAVMLLTIAAASLYSLRSATLARTTLAMTLLYGVGGVAAALWNVLAGKPIPIAYVFAFGLLALGSLLWLLIGVTRPRWSAIPPQYVLTKTEAR